MTNLLPAERVGSQKPRISSYPPYPLTAAPEVIELAESAGLYLDEWQKYVLTHGLGHQVNEQWTARKVSVWVPRQNGKGAIIEALELAWLFLFDEELVVHSAHQHRTSQKAYQRLERMIRNTRDLHRRVRQYRQANGEQQIELYDGRLLQYTTRSRTAVRGFSAPKLVLDEAQELTGEHMSAMLPTVSAMPNWQVWFFGTPPDDPAAWVYGLKADGEAAAPRVAHFDWGLDLDPEDPDDAARIHDMESAYAANPALGIRIERETVEDERSPSGLGDGYPKERLGVWKPRAGGSGVISEQLWRDQVDAEPTRPADIALAVVVAHRRTHTAIMAVGPRPTGGMLTSVVDYRPGTHWVVERLAQLKQRWNPVAIAVQDKGPTGSLSEDMNQAGLLPPEDRDRPRRGDLAIPWSDDVADAYGMWVDAVTERRLWHLDEAPLNAAVAATGTRALGGGTAWDYKGDTDASPVLGSTLAHWAYITRSQVAEEEYDVLESVY